MATMEINNGAAMCYMWTGCRQEMGRQLHTLLRYRWSKGCKAKVDCTWQGVVSSLLPANPGTRLWGRGPRAVLTLSLGT